MTPQIEAVVRLQSLDDRAAELQKEIDALPKHVSAIEKKLESHIQQLEADRGAVAANQKQRKQLEDDIKVQEGKISKLRDQMLQAKTNEQYRAFQHEIEYCEKAIRTAEDKILDLMGAAEPLEHAVKEAEKSLAGEKKVVAQEQEHARQRTGESKKALEAVLTERKTLHASLETKVAGLYDRIRKKWHGTAVSDATEGRCAACQMMLRPQRFQELKQGEGVITCESCGRILYYNPPVDLGPEAQQA